MLRIDLRELRHGPVETEAELSPDDPAFEGLDLRLAQPLEVTGRVQATADGDYFWRGHLSGTLTGECRRCLTDVVVPVNSDIDALFSADPDAADDPSVYVLDESTTTLDLGAAVREELVLAAPVFLLCRDACAGLCPRCGADLNTGPCGCAPAPDTL